MAARCGSEERLRRAAGRSGGKPWQRRGTAAGSAGRGGGEERRRGAAARSDNEEGLQRGYEELAAHGICGVRWGEVGRLRGARQRARTVTDLTGRWEGVCIGDAAAGADAGGTHPQMPLAACIATVATWQAVM